LGYNLERKNLTRYNTVYFPQDIGGFIFMNENDILKFFGGLKPPTKAMTDEEAKKKLKEQYPGLFMADGDGATHNQK